jgi:hypothetical protein
MGSDILTRTPINCTVQANEMYAALYQNRFFVSFRSLNSDTAKFFFEAHYNEGTLESNLANQQRCSALGPGIVPSENT